MLHVASVCTPCCILLRVVSQILKPVKLFSQQFPTFLLFCDRRSVAQQCWIRLHGPSNIVGATHAHYTWITKTYALYSSHDALQVPNLLGVVAHLIIFTCILRNINIKLLLLLYCIRLNATANTHATTPNSVGATMLRDVAPVCTQP